MTNTKNILAIPRAIAGSAASGGYLPVGTRIKFLRTLEEGPDEESPGRLYAEAGQGGVVTGHGCKEGHWVKWDRWPHAAFGAKLGEDFKADNADLRHSADSAALQPKEMTNEK